MSYTAWTLNSRRLSYQLILLPTDRVRVQARRLREAGSHPSFWKGSQHSSSAGKRKGHIYKSVIHDSLKPKAPTILGLVDMGLLQGSDKLANRFPVIGASSVLLSSLPGTELPQIQRNPEVQKPRTPAGFSIFSISE